MSSQIVKGVAMLAPTALRVITPAVVTIATSPTFPVVVGVTGVCVVGMYAIHKGMKAEISIEKKGDDFKGSGGVG